MEIISEIRMNMSCRVNNEIEDFIVQSVKEYGMNQEVVVNAKKIYEALEKQIPKKPHKNFEKFSGVWCSCGNYLGKGYFVDKPSYCSDCGQKLDWGE